MNSLKKHLIILGTLFLFLAVTTSILNAQLYYPPVNPFYGYNYGLLPTFAPPIPVPFGSFAPAYASFAPAYASFAPAYGTSYEAPPYGYRGAHNLITQLALLGLLPTSTPTTSTLLPTYTSYIAPTTLPTTTSTIGYTTALLLGGSSSTSLLLASTLAAPTTTSTIGTTTALLLGGTSTTTLLLLGI